MGKLLKRRISATYQLQSELDKRVHKINDLVSSVSAVPVDGSGAPTDATLDDSYVSANEFARAYHQDIIEYSDIVNDTTTGGASVPASAEAVKSLQLQIDGMANGLEYIGTFDARAGVWPSNVTQGNFFKVSASGTIDGVDLNPGDMIIANKIPAQAQSTVSDWDVIDNTEAADILRDADVSSDSDMSVDSSKLATRSAIDQAILDATAAITIKVKVESATVSGNQFTLSQTPVSSVVFNNEAIIEIDSTNGVYDTWEGVTVSGTTATLSGASTVQYDGLTAKVTYLYI